MSEHTPGPELLAALEALVESIESDMGTYFDDHWDCQEQACTLCAAKAAIKKAKENNDRPQSNAP